jgi:hypothetical protein
MLAQSFMTAEALGITAAEQAALVKVLGMLERGELRHVTEQQVRSNSDEQYGDAFCMVWWDTRHDGYRCGTICCIGGWAERVGNLEFVKMDKSLKDLFYPDSNKGGWEATPAQAATALRSYLTTGEPRWAEALA